MDQNIFFFVLTPLCPIHLSDGDDDVCFISFLQRMLFSLSFVIELVFSIFFYFSFKLDMSIYLMDAMMTFHAV